MLKQVSDCDLEKPQVATRVSMDDGIKLVVKLSLH